MPADLSATPAPSDPTDGERPGPDWECWPDLRVTFRPLPWTWHLKPRLYVDDHGARSMWSFAWLALTVEWWGQDPGHELFPMKAVRGRG
jgi:hypothetical protein